ncbi:hypothetical protein BN2476_230033 [Paraburkholderia piptadeniae]|uniref:Uncharacterized protein n=1 Tax=Paraburkholderia piptadeniae TaxID=1701573 RepID=A0A1N7RXN6_9BURK|nr:hypothetical protein BN2476_230033 [Paraburkholderia piptadeniae]
MLKVPCGYSLAAQTVWLESYAQNAVESWGDAKHEFSGGVRAADSGRQPTRTRFSNRLDVRK